MGEAFGDSRAEGTNRNTVNTDVSYEGRYPTSDKKIYKEGTKTIIEKTSPYRELVKRFENHNYGGGGAEYGSVHNTGDATRDEKDTIYYKGYFKTNSGKDSIVTWDGGDFNDTIE